jgi:SAM-dependent methyltransferase/uncharacterized protein YbaR (Trm112 family)
MTLDLLVCPGCRTWSEERIDVRTLEPDGDGLACECGRRYPVIDGVPIVMNDPDAFVRNRTPTIVEPDVAPEAGAQAVADGPDDAPYSRLYEHLSIYLDAHWGDRAEPPPDGPGAGFALLPFVARIAARPHVELAVELGCSVGRVLAELPADHVMGVDLHFGAIRRARRLLAGERVRYARRAVGRTYTAASCAGLPRAAKLVCSDVLDPPLVPGAFDRVIALNMLDSVAHPRQLVAVIDGLCKPGGEVILSSPYAWQSQVMHDAERIGGTDPAAAVTSIWRDRGYVIEEEAELPWMLRRDARSAVTYLAHYLRARKR